MEENTRIVLDYFERINAIPRCSKAEGRIRGWLQCWAGQRGFSTKGDAAGNLVMRVPASPGYEMAPCVVLQGHMDMVCEKTPDSTHDFTSDPICSHMEGDWLTADGTTLGADNGIAIAYALALADGEAVKHPPLELLFTVDEETGLNGVKAMANDLITGKILINLDSEDEGVFTIGCAGGRDITMVLPLQTGPLSEGSQAVRVVVGGLRGGHSGIDIHKPRANANKLLARVIDHVQQGTRCRLMAFDGGTRHNAIPRDATAILTCEASVYPSVGPACEEMAGRITQECGDKEPDLYIKVAPESLQTDRGATAEGTRRAVDLLLALPNGVAGMSTAIAGLVETSNNLATVHLQNGRMTILSSQRSAVPSRLDEISGRVRAVARLAGAEAKESNQYPPWQPDPGCDLLKRSEAVYRGLYGQAPVIQVIHAGLECAIIGDLYPGIQMISFGPTIRNPHSPSEKLYVPSVAKVWQLLVALLASWVE